MYSIGFDLGGTKCATGVIDDKANIVEENVYATPSSWDEAKVLFTDIVNQYQSSYDIEGIGFGIPGLIGTNGYAYYSPNFQSLNVGVDVIGELKEKIDLPIVIDNDNNCSGYAEANFGSAVGKRVVVSVGLGTGIGGALVIDGKVFRGAHGFAGDFGHATIDIDGPLCACSKRGCFEALASGSALGRIGREYAQRGQGQSLVDLAGSIEDIVGKHVGASAQAGNQDAIAVIDEYAHNISLGLSSLTESLDPDIIVLAGGVVELGDVLYSPLMKHFEADTQGDKNRPRPEIALAKFGEKAGLVGAGTMALSI